MAPNSSIAKRDGLLANYSSIIPGITRNVKRGLPASFETRDFNQIGRSAVLDAAARVECYLRKRIRCAMLDSVRGRSSSKAEGRYSPYKEASHLHTVNLSSMRSLDRDTLSLLIDVQESEALHDAVGSLDPDQAAAVHAQYLDGPRRNSRPRKGEVAAAKKGVKVLRGVLMARAAA